MRSERVVVRMTADEVRALDALRAGETRPATLRRLVREGDPRPVPTPTFNEALDLLAEQARAGKVASTERPMAQRAARTRDIVLFLNTWSCHLPREVSVQAMSRWILEQLEARSSGCQTRSSSTTACSA